MYENLNFILSQTRKNEIDKKKINEMDKRTYEINDN